MAEIDKQIGASFIASSINNIREWFHNNYEITDERAEYLIYQYTMGYYLLLRNELDTTNNTHMRTIANALFQGLFNISTRKDYNIAYNLVEESAKTYLNKDDVDNRLTGRSLMALIEYVERPTRK